MTNFTDKQLEAYAIISDFYRYGEETCVINGYAGTGKTTLLTAFAAEHPNVKIVAPTGKAASVLSEKCKRAGVLTKPTTIHHLFYNLKDKKTDPETGKQILIFEEKHPEGSLEGETVLLDECSMVNESMAHDLMVSGARIIAFGDPAQLPPVMGRQAFPNADYLLTEIHRQAAESAVIRQATSVRNTSLYKPDGDDFRVVSILTDTDILHADAVLCFTNATRANLNKRIRKLLNLSGYPKRGESVMCLKNAKKYGIYNGAIYTLAMDVQPDVDNNPLIISLLVDGYQIDIPYCGFVVSGGALKDFDHLVREVTTAFDYGYAMTVHKAQGSEWDRVAIVDECKRADVRRAWCYTGITRAAKSVIIKR